jgi:hypothetical protein
MTPQPDRIATILHGRFRALRLFAYFYGVTVSGGGNVVDGLRMAWSMTRILLKSYRE